jgi:hypothetical protein
MSRCSAGHAAAGRAAGLHRLEGLAAGMPPPMTSMMSRSVVPMGHLDQAGVDDGAGQREDLGALGPLGADAGEPVAAVR